MSFLPNKIQRLQVLFVFSEEDLSPFVLTIHKVTVIRLVCYKLHVTEKPVEFENLFKALELE